MDIEQKAKLIFPHMVELRRSFHRYPELAFEEIETARSIIKELDTLSIPYDYQGKSSAVIGRLECRDDLPTIALRAEMDALPGAENTDLPFASTIEDKMHACGHDAHMAIVLGAAALLRASPPEGNVLFVFQPAEEKGGGARHVVRSGVLDKVDGIFGAHVTQHYKVGEIMIAEGVITAQSDRFKIIVKGKGGHGARPHEAIDAVVISAQLISVLQTIVSREINPIYPSVITVGQIIAGSAPNVIAEQAVLEGTIRTTNSDTRKHIHSGVKRMAKAMGGLHNANISVRISQGYPPVVNSGRESQIARNAARLVVGDEGLMAMDHPSMGSEDFSYYLDKVPGCYVRFGARKDDGYIPLHSPAFDINEEVLKVGAVYFDQLARQALAEYRH